MPTPLSSADRTFRTHGKRPFRSNLLAFLPIVALIVWAFSNWRETIAAIVRDYNPLPIWDYWQVPDHFARYKAFDLSVLWLQHNEHRIVYPEIVFAIDMLLFRGRQIFALSVSFVCYFGIWLVLAWAFSSDKSLSRHVRVMGILLAGIILGWQGSSVVLSSTFLLQWTMLQIAVALSLAFLSVSRSSRSQLQFAASLACGTIATFSSGNGMLLWPILITAALLLKLPKRQLLILAAAALLNIAAFFVGYRAPNELNLLQILKHPLYFVQFIAAYLSMPVGAFSNPRWAVRSGSFVLITFLLLILLAVRKRLLATTPSIVLFGAFAFAVASGALTAAGRINAADPMFITPRAVRYLTLPLENWATLVLALVWITARCKWRRFPPVIIGVITALAMLWVGFKLQRWMAASASFIADEQVATLSIENGLRDPLLDQKLYSDPGYLNAMLPVLAKNHLAIYSGLPEMSWLGTRVNTAAVRSCEADRPYFVVQPIKDGFAVAGTQPLASADRKIVFVNGRGQIAGFGQKITAGIPAVVGVKLPARSMLWVGFVNSTYSRPPFATFVVDRLGQVVCRIGPPTSFQ